MDDLEYVGLTPYEAVLLRTLIYPVLNGYAIMGPGGEAYEPTQDGMESLHNILNRLDEIELPA